MICKLKGVNFYNGILVIEIFKNRDIIIIKEVIFMSQKEIKIAISNAEASLNMEGLMVSEHTKSLCKKLLSQEITMAEYLELVKQKAGVTV